MYPSYCSFFTNSILMFFYFTVFMSLQSWGSKIYLDTLLLMQKGFYLFRFGTKNRKTMPPFHSSTMCDPAAKFSGKFMIIFFCFLWSSSVSSWLVRCSSSVSFFSDSVWLRFEAKKLSIVQTCFWCDMLKIARCVHHTWLMMRCKQTTCDKIHFPRSVLACNFCTELTLFMCASNSSFFLKFWSLRDNFY